MPEQLPVHDREDIELMLGVRNGNSAALEALYDRHSSAVLGLCARILGDRSEAEDALVEVFYQIWDRRESFDPVRATPLAYLLTIARSRAIDQLRMRQRRNRLIVVGSDTAATDWKPSAPVALDSALHGVLAGELRARVRQAIEQLSDLQREAVALSFFQGLTHREIAERLGEPLGTVKTRIRQGLIRLRDLLRSADPNEKIAR